jgi:hypothetical protein
MRTTVIALYAALLVLFGSDAFAGKSSSHGSSSSSHSSSSSSSSHTSGSSSRSSPSNKPTVVTVSKSRHPESAQHIQDAQAAGHPKVLTVNRGGANANRAESLRDVKPQPGKDRDEYPPAMFKEGGKGASVRHIDPADNRGAGSCVGAQCRKLQDGDKVRIKVVK